MDVRQLRCFVAVAEELHFGKAAERLALAPPALSRIVRALEEELATTLLVRTTRQVSLTRAGLALLEEARNILARFDGVSRSVRDAAASTSRVLRIGAIDAASSSFLPDIFARFRHENPGLDIKFVEAMTAPLLHMLETGRLDLCLCRPPRKALERASDCRFEILRVERPLVMLPVDHPLTFQAEIRMDDLVGQPFVLPSKRSRPYAHDLVMAYFASVGAVPRIELEVSEKPALMSCVAAGLGLALVPDWVARLSFPGVALRRLKGAMFDPPPPGALLGMAWRPHQRLLARDRFIDLLRDGTTLLDDLELSNAGPIPAAVNPTPRLAPRGLARRIMASPPTIPAELSADVPFFSR